MTQIIICSAVLLCADVILAVWIAGSMRSADRIRKIRDWVNSRSDMRKFIGAGRQRERDNRRVSLFRRFELMYIEKSNIRRYIPFMNGYLLALIIVLLFIIVYRPIMKLLGFFPSAVVISGIISVVPLFALELLSRYNAEVVRRNLSDYMSILSRWCSVKEDIMYAFEKSLGSGVGEPLSTFIRDMLIQVKRGMDPAQALDILRTKVDDMQFGDFIINIKLSMKNRGDIVRLLANLESQFYKIDEEYNRRKISTYKDRMIIYFIMFGVLVVAWYFISFTPQINAYYLHTLNGKLLLTVFSGLYAFGFYLTAGIMKFRN